MTTARDQDGNPFPNREDGDSPDLRLIRSEDEDEGNTEHESTDDRDAVFDNIPQRFWNARPILTEIQQAAHARLASADAVLHATLARIAAQLPPSYRVNTGVSQPATLNYYAAMIGDSGIGKTQGVKDSRDIITEPPTPPGKMRIKPEFIERPLGSGEGVIQAYMDHVPDDNGKLVNQQARANVLFIVDEGEFFNQASKRSTSTLGSTIRSAWTGDLLGQQNASSETNRILDPNTYSLGMIFGFQPSTAAPLFTDDEINKGTPQRFGFVAAVDQNLPDKLPSYVGAPPQVEWALPAKERGQQWITMEQRVRNQIGYDRLRKLKGKHSPKPLDAHKPLMKIKFAGLLALLDGRTHVTYNDWKLAGMLWESSCHVRDTLLKSYRDKQQAHDRSAAHRNARREAWTTEFKTGHVSEEVERAAKVIARKVIQLETAKRRDLHNALRSNKRIYLADALEHAQHLDWIVETEDGTFQQGSSRPT